MFKLPYNVHMLPSPPSPAAPNAATPLFPAQSPRKNNGSSAIDDLHGFEGDWHSNGDQVL